MSTPQVVLVLVVVLGWTRHHASHRFALIVKTELSADYIARQTRNQKTTEKISRKDAKAQRKERGSVVFVKNVSLVGQELGEFRRVAANGHEWT
jgi:hypothetical protein